MMLLLLALAPQTVGPWDMDALRKAPSMRWVAETGPLRSLLYAGEKGTEVFAYYASPATLGDAKGPFPGVVLIHGGGGTAFAEWVELWAKRGYAAIAMDLAGRRPLGDGKKTERLPNGGPDQGHAEKFDSIGGSVDDDWPYHAVANVVRAHSLLRSFPEVDPERTAVTGISWGGFTTCLVASVDDRFKAAVPVYGCGFLYEGESVQKPAIDKLGERRDAWIAAYDPSRRLPGCRVPILFVNGTNDVHYPLDSWQKSADVVPGRKQMRLEVGMRHGHPAGWAPEEIGLFIDSYCRDGLPLPVAGAPALEGDGVRLPFDSAVPLKSAQIHYTSDDGPRARRAWRSVPAAIGDGVVVAPKPPPGANTWFLTLVDERGAMVSSPVQFR